MCWDGNIGQTAIPMLVKVSCPCGARFAFDVEPVNGQMPVALSCPTCATDVTSLANDAIAANLVPPATPPPAPGPTSGLKIKGHTVSTAPPSSPAAPAAPAPAAAAAPAPAATKPVGLTIGGKSVADLTAGHKPASPPPAASPSEPAAAADSPPPKSGGFNPLGGSSRPSGAYIPEEGPEANFLHGVGGAFAGAVLGGLIWYAIYHFGEIDFPWCALLPAVLSGGGARWLGKQDNTNLGILAAIFTLMAIFGVRYTIASIHLEKQIKESRPVYKSYDEYLAEAKLAVAAKTDEEIMAFLRKVDEADFNRRIENEIKEGGEAAEKAKKKKYMGLSISRDMIFSFKEDGVEEYKELLNGKPSREEYEAQFKVEDKVITWGMRVAAAASAFISIGIFGLFSTIIILGVAYKVGSG